MQVEGTEICPRKARVIEDSEPGTDERNKAMATKARENAREQERGVPDIYIYRTREK